MSEKNRKFIILFICMNLIYLIFVFATKAFENKSSELPIITFKNDILTVSVDDSQEELLKGAIATDVEDGDISKDIFVYSISTFDDDNTRTITYAVFDSDNQMVTASRKLKYSDYSAPKFSSTKSLINITLSGAIDSSYIQASSSVDGDISNKISVSQTQQSEYKTTYKYSVTDSTGTTSSLEITDEISLNSMFTNIDIELKDYIIYVKKGTTINPRSYIQNIHTSLGNQNELKPYVNIETNYNSQKAGTYEVRYVLNRNNGDYGISKLIIIVE